MRARGTAFKDETARVGSAPPCDPCGVARSGFPVTYGGGNLLDSGGMVVGMRHDNGKPETGR